MSVNSLGSNGQSFFSHAQLLSTWIGK